MTAAAKDTFLVYIGTYTRGDSKGIYAYRFDAAAGKIESLGLAGEATNPSFLAVHPNRRYLYAVGETGSGSQPGSAVSFEIDRATGKLRKINEVSSGGGGPCYIEVDPTGRNALVANYGGGSVAVLPINADGSLKEASSFVQHQGQVADVKRQGGPRAHSIHVSPDRRFVFAADLGLDQLIAYRWDPAAGKLAPNDPPFAKLAPRSGPRHFAFHPNRRFVYAINEISRTVTAFAYDARNGSMREIQTITTVPPEVTTGSTAEVVVHPSGDFLYGSNRGHDSIAAFRIDKSKGTLTPLGTFPTGGRTPRNFNIDPTGRWLLAANQQSNTLVLFRVDRATGKLDSAGVTLEVPVPVCVRFVRLD
jgi:6-phosphogluconolactonase